MHRPYSEETRGRSRAPRHERIDSVQMIQSSAQQPSHIDLGRAQLSAQTHKNGNVICRRPRFEPDDIRLGTRVAPIRSMQPQNADPRASRDRHDTFSQQIIYEDPYNDDALLMISPGLSATRRPSYREVCAEQGEPYAKSRISTISQNQSLVETRQYLWAQRAQSKLENLQSTASNDFSGDSTDTFLKARTSEFDKSAALDRKCYVAIKEAGYVPVEPSKSRMRCAAKQFEILRSGSPGPRSRMRRGFWDFLGLRR